MFVKFFIFLFFLTIFSTKTCESGLTVDVIDFGFKSNHEYANITMAQPSGNSTGEILINVFKEVTNMNVQH
jgi:hypothetical protein